VTNLFYLAIEIKLMPKTKLCSITIIIVM